MEDCRGTTISLKELKSKPKIKNKDTKVRNTLHSKTNSTVGIYGSVAFI